MGSAQVIGKFTAVGDEGEGSDLPLQAPRTGAGDGSTVARMDNA
jgi:hypothetical protein